MDIKSPEQVLERIRYVVAEIIRVDQGKIGLSSRLAEDLGADSLDKITLLMALEEEFGRSITDSQAAALTDIQAVVDLIVKYPESAS